MQERLQKIIARAGIASRRHAEELIQSGFVTVNGHTVTELGSKADESTDHIKVSGKLLRPEQGRVYLVLNKPPEVVSTMSDPEGRRSLQDLLHGVPLRVFPVGRLEYHSTGLVFLTNDGELANRMLKAHHLKQIVLAEIEDTSHIRRNRAARAYDRRAHLAASRQRITMVRSNAFRSAARCASQQIISDGSSRRKNQTHPARKPRARIASARRAPNSFLRRCSFAHKSD